MNRSIFAGFSIALLMGGACGGIPHGGGHGGAGGTAGTAGTAGTGGTSAACDCSDVDQNTAHLPLACRCSGNPSWSTCSFPDCSCPASIEEAQQQEICTPHETRIRTSGCGKVSFEVHTGYTATGAVFDESTGELVGMFDASDAAYGQCSRHTYVYGDTLLGSGCADVKRCFPCNGPCE